MGTKPWLARPLDEFVRNVATSVVEAQTEIEKDSMEMQRRIDEAVEEGELEHELDAPWYKFSDVSFDVNVAMQLNGREVYDEDGNVRAYEPEVAAFPIGPRFADSYDYDTSAADNFHVDLVQIPPETKRENGGT